ncbi:uncharacterized protein LOC143478054 [Brachyhypopomus gauderio]|uniref:uncharacterized protein LOC143478054 n=1 Tax=Brachyhypopomus gauderio TaxID=698409 RepID=UPI004042A4DB
MTDQEQRVKMRDKGIFSLYGVLSVLCLVSEGRSESCECLPATSLPRFPSSLLNGSCCLNFTGSLFNRVPWTAFSSVTHLKILDLSHCNLTQIDSITVGSTPSSLQELYLGQNHLTTVPRDFLTDAYGLELLDLGGNLLKDLPVDFLQNSKSLRVLLLRGNRLRSLPRSVLRPSLQQLELEENPWACTCSLVEALHGVPQHNSSALEGIVGNLSCASPQRMTGRSVWSVRPKEVCRTPGLTALFIILPLLLLLGLVFCWCCGRKGERKESPAFSTPRKKPARPEWDGRWPRDKPSQGETPENGEITKHKMMLRPSSTLLGSTRDIYEEVEVKLGSVDSLGPPPSSSSVEGTAVREECQELGSKQDLETVSVSEVMKDSADREKAYMTQPTKYYSLVPGLELEDSDHGEYESVDLS